MALWPAFFTGKIAVPTAFSAIDWHAHEMIFGYVVAVATGFLLTAIPNWTGRLPVARWPLAGLAALWAAGRVAVFFSEALGRALAGAIDCAFLIVFAAVVARELIAGRNWHNLKVLALLVVLALTNLAFHVEDQLSGFAEYATRAALGVIVMLILLIDGRVTPSFTGNWLARTGARERPAAFGRADAAVLAVSGVSLAIWVAWPEGAPTGALALAASAANFWRLSRWRGLASVIPYDSGVHVWAVGAIGMMTLAMMTRATLGHCGRPLVASRGTRLAYACIAVAVAARVAMPILPAYGGVLMHVAAVAWMLAFAAFLVVYAPLLARRNLPT
jgi:uncharacterized protein involved in response to NO